MDSLIVMVIGCFVVYRKISFLIGLLYLFGNSHPSNNVLSYCGCLILKADATLLCVSCRCVVLLVVVCVGVVFFRTLLQTLFDFLLIFLKLSGQYLRQFVLPFRVLLPWRRFWNVGLHIVSKTLACSNSNSSHGNKS